MAILVDSTALDLSVLTSEEMREVGRIIQGFSLSLGRTSRRAVVVLDGLQYGLAWTGQSQIDDPEDRIRVFTSREDAEAWLQHEAA